MTDHEKALIAAYRSGNQAMVDRVLKMMDKPAKPASVSDRAESVGKSAAMGIADPFLGASQLIYRGGSALAGAAEYAGVPGAKSVREWMDDGVSDVDYWTKAADTGVQNARKDAGFEGFDASRLAGNILSPANAVPALGAAGKIQKGATLGNVAMQGAKVGGLSASLAPVIDTDNYAREKIAQVGLGTVGGAVLSPIANKLSTSIAQRIKQAGNALNKQDPSELMMKALSDAGIDAQDFSKSQMDAIRGEVAAAMKTGKLVSPAAIARKLDFDELGVPGTSGQILADPAQFSKEKNLRGLAGIGEPLMDRFNEQERRIAELIGKRAVGAKEQVTAGENIMGGLQNIDDRMSSRVSDLYRKARAETGAKADVATTGLAQDIGDISRRYEGDLPKGLLNQLDDYGLAGGAKAGSPADAGDLLSQKRVFDFEDANRMIKETNKYWSPTDKARQSSLNEVRSALKRAMTETPGDGDPFALPRKAASERFKLHEEIDALDAVVSGKASPDNFIDKYVIKGKTQSVEALSKILTPDARQEIQAHIGDALRNAAYGTNKSGAKAFRPDSYNRLIDQIGDRKLRAIFSPEDVAEIKRIGRVGAYMTEQPANATVNNSNTASALYNAARATGSGMFNQPLLDFLPKVADRYSKSQAVSYGVNPALRAEPPMLPSHLRRNIGILSSGSGLAGSLLLSRPVE